MTHRLTTVPLRDQYSNTVEMIFFLPQPREGIREQEGMRTYCIYQSSLLHVFELI